MKYLVIALLAVTLAACGTTSDPRLLSKPKGIIDYAPEPHSYMDWHDPRYNQHIQHGG